MKVLNKITFDDGSSTRFDYNGYGQIEKVNNYAADGTTKLNSVATNLDSVTGTQTDVPRLTQQRSYVKDFNNGNEVVVNNTLSASTTTPSISGESSESAKIIQVKMVNNPYDGNNYTTETNQNISPVQHDKTNYGTSYNVGRGSVTKVTRHNVVDATTTDSEIYYNVAGSPMVSISPDPSDINDRRVTTDYTDKFVDDPGNSLNRNTYAYPTTLTDPNGKSSNVTYRYDIGANVEATSPEPTGYTTGKVSKRIYDDSNGRLRRNSIQKGGNEHFYTRYFYPYESGNSYNQSASYSVLVAGKGEVETRNSYDGAGRVLRSRTPHRITISGTWRWSGTKVEYDI